MSISRALCNVGNNRPPYSFSGLILRAIRKSPNQRLTLHEILESIMEEFPYYREVTNKNWQNNVRHKLTIQSCFQKITRKSDDFSNSTTMSRPTHRPGHYWIVDPKTDENYLARMERSNRSFFKCYYCDACVNTFRELQDHMKNTHEEFKHYKSFDKKNTDDDDSSLLNCAEDYYMEENEMLDDGSSSVKKNKWENRPPYSFSGLIIRAIQKSPEQRLTLREIYDSIMTEFPYYR